jgi:hypothetical protein
MAIGKEYYSLLRTSGGVAFEYQNITESDFAAANGIAYSPPETGIFRRIASLRQIQIQSECPVVVETFQTTSAILRLPANTNLDSTNDSGNGRFFIMKNSGTGTIQLQDYLGTNLYLIFPSSMVFVIGNNNNTWDFFGNVLAGGGTGVTPPFVFSKDGQVNVGAFLRTGSVPTNLSGQLIKGSNYIVAIEVTGETNASVDTRIQFFQRTGRTSRVNISGAYCDVLSGQYKGSRSGLMIPMGPDWEIGCYNLSGGQLNNVVVTLFLIPQ